MILLFRTRTNQNGAVKGLKIDTEAKTFKNGHYVLTVSELTDAIIIRATDYKNIITECKKNNFQKIVIE